MNNIYAATTEGYRVAEPVFMNTEGVPTSYEDGGSSLPPTRGEFPAERVMEEEEKRPVLILPVAGLSTSNNASSKHFRPSRNLTAFMNMLCCNVTFPAGTSLVAFKLPEGIWGQPKFTKYQKKRQVCADMNPAWPRGVPFSSPRVRAEGSRLVVEWDYHTGCLPVRKDIGSCNKWRDIMLDEWGKALNAPSSLIWGNSHLSGAVDVMSVCTVRAIIFVMWITRATKMQKCNFKESRCAFDRIYAWFVTGMTGEADDLDRSGLYRPPPQAGDNEEDGGETTETDICDDATDAEIDDGEHEENGSRQKQRGLEVRRVEEELRHAARYLLSAADWVRKLQSTGVANGQINRLRRKDAVLQSLLNRRESATKRKRETDEEKEVV